MAAETKLLNRRALFWDIKPGDIKKVLVESDEWVVQRVFQYGELSDIESVIELYGVERTKEILSEAELDDVAYAMGYIFLGLDRQSKYAL